MNRVLQLSHLKPLAQGRMRLVFEHPEDRSQLVKVIRPDVIEKRWGSGAAWYKRRRRYGRYISYIREIQEYVAAYSSCGHSPPFAQKITGLVETDMGLGLVMEAVRDQTGHLAPSLTDLILRQALDGQARFALRDFLDRVVKSELLIADLNPGNMVYVNDQAGGRFILIDGIGEASALPLKRWFKALNQWSKRGRAERLWRSIAKREAVVCARQRS